MATGCHSLNGQVEYGWALERRKVHISFASCHAVATG
jgi:hypothetical protein